jgi:hypothetical protein
MAPGSRRIKKRIANEVVFGYLATYFYARARAKASDENRRSARCEGSSRSRRRSWERDHAALLVAIALPSVSHLLTYDQFHDRIGGGDAGDPLPFDLSRAACSAAAPSCGG